MRNLIRGLAFTAGAYLSYYATRAIKSAKESRSYDEAVPEPPAPTEEYPQLPQFEAGDLVVTVNPYTQDYCYEDFDGTPLYYEVIAIYWDDTSGVYRYQLDGEDPDEHFAESWLQLPEHATFSKRHVSVDWLTDFRAELDSAHQNSKGDDEMFGHNWGSEYDGLGEAAARQRKQKAEAERKQVEFQRKYEIDYWLMSLQIAIEQGNDADKAEANEKLAELTAE